MLSLMLETCHVKMPSQVRIRERPQFAWPRYHNRGSSTTSPGRNVAGRPETHLVPYTGQSNDAGMLARYREADYFPADDPGISSTPSIARARERRSHVIVIAPA